MNRAGRIQSNIKLIDHSLLEFPIRMDMITNVDQSISFWKLIKNKSTQLYQDSQNSLNREEGDILKGKSSGSITDLMSGDPSREVSSAW